MLHIRKALNLSLMPLGLKNYVEIHCSYTHITFTVNPGYSDP